MARLVFMGTPQFAVPSLEACLALGEVVAVVTQPDKPKGRGQALAAPPVKEAALARGIRVLQPAKIRGTPFAQELAALGAEAAVVTAYGKILPPDVLAAFPKGCLNVHGSLLPRFRGAAPIQRAIAAGDAQTGVCLMKMDEGMDTGAVIASAATPIGPADTSATLHDRLSAMGGALLREHLLPYLRGERTPVPQPTDGVVMAPMIDKSEGQLDFSAPAAVLERRLRAFTPWPGAFTFEKGALLKVHQVRVGAGRGAPGTVLTAGPAGLEVACGEGSLWLEVVQPEGKKPMPVADYLRGRPLAVGSAPFEGKLTSP